MATRFRFWSGALTALIVGSRLTHADPPPPIQDNSFLIEEAYNQEKGVIQHIQTYQLMRDHRIGSDQEDQVSNLPDCIFHTRISAQTLTCGMKFVWVYFECVMTIALVVRNSRPFTCNHTQ